LVSGDGAAAEAGRRCEHARVSRPPSVARARARPARHLRRARGHRRMVLPLGVRNGPGEEGGCWKRVACAAGEGKSKEFRDKVSVGVREGAGCPGLMVQRERE
jgi:hypothetical protein